MGCFVMRRLVMGCVVIWGYSDGMFSDGMFSDWDVK